MERRASSSIIGGYLPSVQNNKIQITKIDHEPKRLACNEYRVPAIQRIDQQQCATADREKPESHRDHALARAFRRDPLHHKAHGEKSLRHEAKNDPAVKFDDEDVVKVTGE